MAAAAVAAYDGSSRRRALRSTALEIERDTVLAERDAALSERDAAQAEIEKLRLLIRQLQRGQFGRRSEKLDPDQLQLGLEDLEQAAAAAEAAQEEVAARDSTPRAPRVRRRNLGALPAHLPRVEVLVDVEDKSCPCCGGALHVIGEAAREMLDIVPAQLRVKVIRRPRYACRACEEAVVQAPAPERPITGGMATEALLAHVLVAKYADFLPLYRQAGIFARQGIDLDRSTLCDWVGRACWWLEPLWRLLRRHVMASTRSSPTTPRCRCSTPAGAGPRPAGCGATPSTTGRGAGAPRRRWSTSTPRTARASIRPRTWPGSGGCCRSTATAGSRACSRTGRPGRSGSPSAGPIAGGDFTRSTRRPARRWPEEALRRIGELYEVEAEIRGRPAEERRATRQERSRPIVEALHAWLTAQLGRVSGKSGLAEAIRYALRHWQGLVLFLEDGRLELDTNSHRAGDPPDRPGAQE